uniref:Uncharacterized protein n=1 Tax=Caenorhabditis japonica TaxID=281687 RepID=A0A8R1IEY3_CAEJA
MTLGAFANAEYVKVSIFLRPEIRLPMDVSYCGSSQEEIVDANDEMMEKCPQSLADMNICCAVHYDCSMASRGREFCNGQLCKCMNTIIEDYPDAKNCANFANKTCLGSAEIARRLQKSSSTVRILRRHFAGGPFILQQDWAPSHGSRSTLAVLEAHFPGFLDKNLWPASSPDLNPMDFSVWGMLEGKIAGKVFATVDDLKAALEVAWASIDDGYLRRTVNSVKKRLRACVKARGSNFEILL